MVGGGATRTWRLLGLAQELDEPEAALRERAARAIGVEPGALRGFRIARRSLDARRRRGELRFVCHVDLVVGAGERPAALRRALRSGRALEAPGRGSLEVEAPPREGVHVVVVGAGPAGVFAALTLGRNGARVTLLERGARLERRGPRVVAFHRRRVVDGETNLLFGEGGAGTYSDGKLYTRVDDPLEVPLLEELVDCGAPPDVLYDSRAHIGTDRLHRLLPRLRAKLEAAGVELRFDVRLERLVLDAGSPRRVRAVETSAGALACDALLLACGHSARDTWEGLHAQGVAFEARPFQLGVRIEHPQELVTRGRYGSGAAAALLGPASYNLVCRAGDGVPAAHSFCMCPGGRIVASVSEAGLLCTNGMSNARHSSSWANAALVATLGPVDFAAFGEGPFAGVALQRALEARAFEAGGGDYTAPAQRAPDFLAGRLSEGELRSSFTFGTRPARVDRLVPERVHHALCRALERFERAIPGFAGPAGLLVGIESRSASPVRMPRDAGRRAVGFANLYPAGEGAGWAGGIMSAALDGVRSAQALLGAAVSRG